MDERNMLLKKISQAQFAAWDLHLFLDSHPNCKRALAKYKHYHHITIDLIEQYESRFGPLISGSVNDETQRWAWINDPWPWENQCNSNSRGGSR